MSPSRCIALFTLALAAGPFASAASAATNADLGIGSLTMSGDRTVGSVMTYDIQVSNAGPDAVDATVTDQLGAAEQLVSASATQGSCTQTAPATCDLGPVAPGAPPVQITVRAKLVSTGDNAHVDTVSGPADNTDANPGDNSNGAEYQVVEPEAPVVETPSAVTGEWSRTQSKLKVDATLSPYGSGTYYFEYGRTSAYGDRTATKTITGNQGLTGKATIAGLTMNTRYHYRVVLVVDGKSYRGKDRAGTTLGKLRYGPLSLKAVSRTPSSTTYTGLLGGGLADAPHACTGRVTIDVYTLANADLLIRGTRLRSDCTYRITIPFGAKQRAKYGKKGFVLVQAEFQGNRAVSRVGSASDRP